MADIVVLKVFHFLQFYIAIFLKFSQFSHSWFNPLIGFFNFNMLKDLHLIGGSYIVMVDAWDEFRRFEEMMNRIFEEFWGRPARRLLPALGYFPMIMMSK